MQRWFGPSVLVRVLLVMLAALFVVVTAALVGALVAVVPRVSALVAGELPPGWTMLAIAVPGLVCVLVVIVCTARLSTMTTSGHIFSVGSFPWVDAIVWALAAGWVLLGVAAFPVFVVADLDDAPGLLALHLVVLLVGAVVCLLMAVMRRLLRQATTLRTDMEAVI